MGKKDRIYLALIALLSLAVFYPHFFSGKIILWLDTLFYFLPFRILPAELVREGIVPLWNPYIYCGNPMMGNMQSAVFNPLNIFYYVLSTEAAFRVTTFIAFYIMSAFMYMFMRLYKVSEEGSFIASVSFSLSFFMTVKAPEFADIQVMAWLPAILYFTKKYFIERRIRNSVFIPIVLSLSFLGGHPQIFFYVYIMFASLYVYEMLSFKKDIKRDLSGFILINLVFVLLIMLQLIPFLKFISLCGRTDTGVSFEVSSGTYMRFEQLLFMFFPFLNGFFSTSVVFLNWMSLIDVGVPVMILFLAGIAAMKDRKLKIFLLSSFVLVLLFSTIGRMPFYEFIFEHFRFFRLIRYPSKVILLIAFIISFFAGFGFDAVFSGDKRKKATVFISIFALLYFLGYMGAELFKEPMIKFYKDTFNPLMSFQQVVNYVNNFDIMLKGFMKSTVVLSIFALLLYLRNVKDIQFRYMREVILAVAVIGMFTVNVGGYNFYGKYREVISGSKNIDFLKENMSDSRVRLLSPPVGNKFEFDVHVMNASEFLYYEKDCLSPNVPMIYKFRNSDGFDSMMIGRFKRFSSLLSNEKKPWDMPLFSLLSTKYISARSEINGEKIKEVRKGFALIYEYSDYLETAFFIPDSSRVIYETDINKITEIMKDENFDPAMDLVIEREGIQSKSITYEKNETTITEFDNSDVNTFRMKVMNNVPGYLVLTDNNYPGWKVFVNGEKQSIYTADMTFKSVFLDKGVNEVVFLYRPIGYVVGSIISIMTILLILAFSAIMIRAGKNEH